VVRTMLSNVLLVSPNEPCRDRDWSARNKRTDRLAYLIGPEGPVAGSSAGRDSVPRGGDGCECQGSLASRRSSDVAEYGMLS
jgi:hypothetical protein